jgi:hypothetical protein
MQNEVKLTIEDIANHSGVSVPNVKRLLRENRTKPGDLLRLFFTYKPVHSEENKSGKKEEFIFLIRPDEPLTPKYQIDSGYEEPPIEFEYKNYSFGSPENPEGVCNYKKSQLISLYAVMK